MKVEWTKDLPTEAGWYWLCDETPTLDNRRLVNLFTIDGEMYFTEDGMRISVSEQIFNYGGWWAPAELPEPPEE